MILYYYGILYLSVLSILSQMLMIPKLRIYV